jgi:hypothetical protein
MTLLMILEELKERPVKRGSVADDWGGLAKRIKGVDLGN